MKTKLTALLCIAGLLCATTACREGGEPTDITELTEPTQGDTTAETPTEVTGTTPVDTVEPTGDTTGGAGATGTVDATGTGDAQTSAATSATKPAETKKPAPTEKIVEVKPLEPLSKELELRIKEDWVKDIVSNTFGLIYPEEHPNGFSVDNVYIKHYLGTYNGRVAVMMDGYAVYTEAIWDINVAGYAFRFRDGNGISIWYGGEFKPLEPGTYDAGLLTKDDIGNIWHYWNNR